MSRYTTEVRYICESLIGRTTPATVDEMEGVILSAYPKIFTDKVVVEPAEHREELLCKILEHYYTREIGFETFGLWKQKLNTRMKQIMPYYNEMYKTVGLEFNPINDVDYSREIDNTHNDNNVNASVGSSETTNSSHVESSYEDTAWNKYSDTPQGGVDGLESDRYLTNATNTTDESESSQTNSGSSTTNNSTNGSDTNTGEYHTVERVKGKMGMRTYASMLLEYRKAIINIDMMIINELGDLFMNLW